MIQVNEMKKGHENWQRNRSQNEEKRKRKVDMRTHTHTHTYLICKELSQISKTNEPIEN